MDVRHLPPETPVVARRRAVLTRPRIGVAVVAVAVVAALLVPHRWYERALLALTVGIVALVGQLRMSRVRERLEQAVRGQMALAVLGRRAVEGAPIDEILDDVVALAAQALGADIATVFESAGGSQIRCAAHVGWPGSADWIPLAPDSQARYVLDAPASVVTVADYDEPQPFVPADLLRDVGVRCTVSARVGTRSTAYGLVSVHRTSRRPFDDEDRTFLAELANLVALVIDRHRHAERLVNQAGHDPLTQLANRRHFTRRLRDSAPPDALLLIDLDRFKEINDTHGHAMGDRVLQVVANRLRVSLHDGDVAVRLGGDEFAIAVAESSSSEETLARAHALAAFLAEPIALDELRLDIGASIGVATNATPEMLTRNADVALYAAKHGGRGRAVLFDADLHDALTRRREMSQRLTEAVRNDMLSLHYQPVVSLRTGRTTCVEALCRWSDPKFGDVPPAIFIPLAEESGLIGALGRFVLGRAVEDLRAMRVELGAADLGVSVNLSPRQLTDPELPAYVAATIAAAGIEPGALQLELTEHELAAHRGAIDVLHRLHDLGVRLAIDDFGVAESSLARLHELPVDCLKIDRTFLADASGTRRNRDVLSAIVAIAGALGLTTVAEGVETAEQCTLVADAGCDAVQGFLFARPMPYPELLAWLAASMTSP